jgi:hypothetical protein
VSDEQRSERSARARPVADAPVDVLLQRGEDLARRWAIALVLERPLAEMAEVPLEDLAREAPGVCAQVVRALDSEAELARIAASEGSRGRAGAAPTVRLGALDARATVEHIEALRGVIWEATLAELDDPPVRLVADLADRLAFVCATLLAAALGEGDATGLNEAPHEAPTPTRGQVLFTAPEVAPGKRGAALIDEFEDALAQPQPHPQARARDRRGERASSGGADSRRAVNDTAPVEPATERVASRAGARAARTTPRPLPWDTPLQPPSTARAASEQGIGAERRAGDDAEHVVRITRGPSSLLDERS